jgi:hypothetical protein
MALCLTSITGIAAVKVQNMKHLLTKQCDPAQGEHCDDVYRIETGAPWRAVFPREWPMSDPNINEDFLKYIDGELARLWRLGMNAIIGWSSLRDGIAVLSVPQFLLPSILPNYENILVGSRKMSKSKLQAVSNICERG